MIIKKLIENANLPRELSIGEKIREVRKIRRMTQKRLADLIGCKSSFVSHIERNSRNLSLAYLTLIAAALEIPVYRLLLPERSKITPCIEHLEELDAEHLKMASDYLTYLREHQKKDQN